MSFQGLLSIQTECLHASQEEAHHQDSNAAWENPSFAYMLTFARTYPLLFHMLKVVHVHIALHTGACLVTQA